MVAAGIAAKNEKVLPYLAAGRSGLKSEKLDLSRIGIDYGYSFMEKFIQVPFHVPRPNQNEVIHWISAVTGSDDVTPSGLGVEVARPNSMNICAGSDPEEFQNVVNRIAQIFRFNPRRLKQFINVFRLRVMIAVSIDVLAPAPASAGGARQLGGITIQQLGLFTAVLMRWSQLAGDLIEEPTLFDQLTAQPTQNRNGIAAKWAGDEELLKAIELDQSYSLLGLDLIPLLMIMPDAYSGVLGERKPRLPRTRLVANTPEQSLVGLVFKTSGASNTATNVATGATGASGPFSGTLSMPPGAPPAA
jgi:hypothetical protein